MQTKRSARSATIFARQRAATALDHAAPGSTLVGAADVERERLDLVGVDHREAALAQAQAALSELDTAAATRLRHARELVGMKWFTVEPVPTPVPCTPIGLGDALSSSWVIVVCLRCALRWESGPIYRP